MTTYYVATAGSDAANGTSPATPWQTIAKVNGSTFNAGDSVLLNRGDTFREQLIAPSSGSAGSPITFGAYGSGAKPIIRGDDLFSAGWTADTSTSSLGATATPDGSSRSSAYLYFIKITTPSGSSMSLQGYHFTMPDTGYPDKMHLALYASGAGVPDGGALIANSDTGDITSFSVGDNYIALGSPPTLSASTDYWIAFQQHTESDGFHIASGGLNNRNSHSAHTYGSFESTAVATDNNDNTFAGLTVPVQVSGVANVWNLTLGTQPYIVWFNGTYGAVQSSKAALTGASKWFWGSSILSVYSTSNPATAFTSPGIEAAQRNSNFRVDGVNYVTADGLEFERANDTNVILKNSTGSVVKNGVIHDVRDNGILIFNTSSGGGHTIQGNEIYGSGINTSSDGSGNGIQSLNSVTVPLLIQNNYIHDIIGIYAGTAGSAHDHGIYNTSTSGDTIRYNHFKNIPGLGVKNDTSPVNVQVYDNLFESCAIAGTGLLNGATGAIYNNTIYNSGTSSGEPPYGFFYSGIWCNYNVTATSIIKNNIIYGSHTGIWANPMTSGITSDYNLIYGATHIGQWGTDIPSGAGTTYDTIAAWRTATGQDAHSIVTDPLFVSAATGDFRLTATSPAINAGVNVGLTTDYTGHALQGLPDIGAYEYVKLIGRLLSLMMVG